MCGYAPHLPAPLHPPPRHHQPYAPPAETRVRFANQHVAIRNGQVVDHDADQPALGAMTIGHPCNAGCPMPFPMLPVGLRQIDGSAKTSPVSALVDSVANGTIEPRDFLRIIDAVEIFSDHLRTLLPMWLCVREVRFRITPSQPEVERSLFYGFPALHAIHRAGLPWEAGQLIDAGGKALPFDLTTVEEQRQSPFGTWTICCTEKPAQS